jgi:hypothetical protein
MGARADLHPRLGVGQVCDGLINASKCLAEQPEIAAVWWIEVPSERSEEKELVRAWQQRRIQVLRERDVSQEMAWLDKESEP